MKTYADVLNSMNAELKKATEEVEKLENSFNDARCIINYLNTFNKQE